MPPGLERERERQRERERNATFTCKRDNTEANAALSCSAVATTAGPFVATAAGEATLVFPAVVGGVAGLEFARTEMICCQSTSRGAKRKAAKEKAAKKKAAQEQTAAG